MFQNRLVCLTGLLLLPLALPFTSFGQAAPCSFTVSPASFTVPNTGGNYTFTVTPSAPSCSWNVNNGSLGPFIGNPPGTAPYSGVVTVGVVSGIGTGTVPFTVRGVSEADSGAAQQFILVGNVPPNSNGYEVFLAGMTGAPSTLGTVTIFRAGCTSSNHLPFLSCPSTASSLSVTTKQLTIINGQAYSAALTATGGTPPYTWRTPGDDGPAYGVQLSPTGVLSSNGAQVQFSSIPENQLPQLSIFTPVVTDSAGSSVTANIPSFLVDSPCVSYGYGGDTDGDGLCDNWETNGLDVSTPSGTVHLNLPAMGANPLHKDIFVQADYMVAPATICSSLLSCSSNPGHTHKPLPAAMSQVIDAFANAPVSNPDMTTGIHIHIDCGQDCVMNRLPGQPDQLWGNLSKAHPISDRESLATELLDVWGAFHLIKATNLSPERAQVFHYSEFVHNLSHSDLFCSTVGGCASGISFAIGASDFIVSLAALDPAGKVGQQVEQSGSFTHELGHNLGLGHGGYEALNFKPNYLSVMNYFFQLSGLMAPAGSSTIDYSRGQNTMPGAPALPSLDERSLDERTGLTGGSGISGYGTKYFCPGVGSVVSVVNHIPVRANPNENIEAFTFDGNAPIDWNCNGIPEAIISPTAISNCGNTTTDSTCSAVPKPLNGYNDWANLIYVGGSIGALGIGNSSNEGATSPPEADSSVLRNIGTNPYAVEITGAGTFQALAGTRITLTITIKNTGLLPDSYTLSTSSTIPWPISSSLPSSLTLSAGSSQSFTVQTTVPAVASIGLTNLFTIGAVSQTNNSIQASGNAEITVIGGSSQLSGSIFSVTPGSPSVVAIQITNAGPGPALNATISGITARTLGGSGTVSVADTFPIALGNLSVGIGGTVTVNVPVNIPSSVTRFSLTENGTVQNAAGATLNFSIGELVQP